MQLDTAQNRIDPYETLHNAIFASHALSDIYDLALADKTYSKDEKTNLESLKHLNDARWRRTYQGEVFYREYEEKYAFHEYPDLVKTLPRHAKHHSGELAEAVKNFGDIFFAALPKNRKGLRSQIDRILAEMESPSRPLGNAYAARGAEAVIAWIR